MCTGFGKNTLDFFISTLPGILERRYTFPIKNVDIRFCIGQKAHNLQMVQPAIAEDDS